MFNTRVLSYMIFICIFIYPGRFCILQCHWMKHFRGISVSGSSDIPTDACASISNEDRWAFNLSYTQMLHLQKRQKSGGLQSLLTILCFLYADSFHDWFTWSIEIAERQTKQATYCLSNPFNIFITK